MTGRASPHTRSHPRRWWRSLTGFLAARFDPHSSLGLWLTLDVVLLAGAVWGFGGLLEEVLDREALVRWDIAVVRWLRAHSSSLGDGIFSAVTILGSPVNYVIVGAVALWLLWKRERFLLVTLLAGTAGGKLLELALKTTIHRRRPSEAAEILSGHTFSFPSGHAMNATVCYTLVAFVLATALESRVHVRARWYATAAAIALAVAFSRIYLGMHFPSDVIGGLAAGVAWVVLCMAVVKVARSRMPA
ncbi:MAG TPA: phosphatase PAP2 family protein [Gemmatimonadaceae bacterium]|jgi:undecaprenyl-diphosphatase|nr:phosphatase PAP2 family protein [Gemmatimonadaceae bacterium]